jgi:hypothetical protein
MRTYRRNKRMGLRVRPVRLSLKEAQKLVELGYLSLDSKGDKRAEAIAIEALSGGQSQLVMRTVLAHQSRSRGNLPFSTGKAAAGCRRTTARPFASIVWRRAPKVLEAGWGKFGVLDGVLNSPMPKPILDSPGIMPRIEEAEPSTLAYALDKAINGVRRKWSAAFGGEHIAAVWELPPQLAQRSYLIAPQRVNRSFPILGSTHMQGS